MKLTPETFPAYCEASGLPRPTQEVMFHPVRKWRLDWAFVGHGKKVALESDGSTFGTGKPCPVCRRRAPGGHSSAAGISRDQEKANEAQLHGWLFLRCKPQDIENGSVIDLLKRAFGKESNP